MSPPDTLRAQQQAFAAHLRDPDGAPPPPGVEPRRLRVYRELFLGSLDGLLSGHFPVAKRLLGEPAWTALVAGFYREHRCTTPLFPELPGEFADHLAARAAAGRGDPPWLAELAHYERVELALDFSPAEPSDAPHDPAGDLLDGIPVVSPLAWPLAYAWPVHRLAPGHVPDGPPPTPTFLLVRRDADRRVRFDEISAATFRLLQRLDAIAATGRAHLAALAAETGAPDAAGFVAAGHAMLRRLHETGVVLGTRPAEAAAAPP